MANEPNRDASAGLVFSETMSGYVAVGIGDFEEGEQIGTTRNDALSFSLSITIENVDEFCNISDREASAAGTVTYVPIGKNLPITNGRFSLFRPDRETGRRRMVYSLGFAGPDGAPYFLYGYKVISDDPGMDVLEDMTRLYTRIYRGSSQSAPLYGSGIMHFHMTSLPAMISSFTVTGSHSIADRIAAVEKFFALCYGELRSTYLAKLSPVYHANYENLVLTGRLDARDGRPTRDFLLFSGVHDKGFPWGDDEVFWDLGLVTKGPDGWERYALTGRTIENLRLDVRNGVYRYTGPLFRIIDGCQVSHSELGLAVLPPHLKRTEARVEIAFEADEYDTVNVPFSMTPNYRRIVPRAHVGKIEELLPHLRALGWHLGPHNIRAARGTITIDEEGLIKEYAILPGGSRGEGERSVIDNIRWPKLYYHYLCGLNPDSGETRIQVSSDVLREDRREPAVDEVLRTVGKIVNHVAFLDLLLDREGCRLLPHDETPPLKVTDDNILEINNDQFPIAVFQRRVVAVQDGNGAPFLAMEEEMDPLNLGPLHSDRTVTVAAVKDKNKFTALDAVVEASRFFAVLDDAWVASGKDKQTFSILIKPNFMFMYNVKDVSTYTDPELVEHLIDRIREKGYCNIAVAEARSTYGVFYTNREVATVARHIGYSGLNYRIVDLSLDLEPHAFSGGLGQHYVNREWKAADFRVSFAKNKTHVYALYTLALKCIYGALPMENKFKEYHHDRDIFRTTIEFLRHFPAHFAFIDAFVSSDGPFGVFADTEPNRTETIIGSEDLVAADWIGAAKMGLDPMDSDYMKEAVAAFGKPRIRFTGDRTIYPDWVNVGDLLPWGALNVLDRHYYFGNLFYSVMSYMEPFFHYKEESVARRLGRVLASPIKEMFFQTVRNGQFDAEANKMLWEQFTESGVTGAVSVPDER